MSKQKKEMKEALLAVFKVSTEREEFINSRLFDLSRKALREFDKDLAEEDKIQITSKNPISKRGSLKIKELQDIVANYQDRIVHYLYKQKVSTKGVKYYLSTVVPDDYVFSMKEDNKLLKILDMVDKRKLRQNKELKSFHDELYREAYKGAKLDRLVAIEEKALGIHYAHKEFTDIEQKYVATYLAKLRSLRPEYLGDTKMTAYQMFREQILHEQKVKKINEKRSMYYQL